MSTDFALDDYKNLPSRFLTGVYRWALILTLIVAVMLSVSGSVLLVFNFAIGVGISLLFLRITQILVERYLVPDNRRQPQKNMLMVLLLGKLTLLVIVCALLVTSASALFQPLWFVLGVSVIPGLIVVFGGAMALKMR
ncbi:MAG: hypothetical protein VYA69_01170 [Gemmatimonadota bacterium]|nr:hypothetical protein [Gemmatimonadota bacterium]